MRVLGVDPGLGRCGWAVLERRGGRVAAAGYGTIHTDGEQVAPRLAELAARLRQVLATHRPEALAIERLFFNANVRTAMTVGQASGVVLLLAAEHGLEVTAYTPPQVKQAVTGTGSAPKEQVGYMVKALLGLAAVPAPADTADALAVALCHLNHAGLAGTGGTGVGRPVPPAPGRLAGPGRPDLAGAGQEGRRPVIASLRGRLLEVLADGAVIEVGGVGYRVFLTPKAAAGLPRDGEVLVHTVTYVREDTLALYGFATTDERRAFEQLLTATGVGPKLALAVLAVHAPDALRRAVSAGDTDALTLVPGVGRKGAARLILELKGKLGDGEPDLPAEDGRPPGLRRGPRGPRRPRLRPGRDQDRPGRPPARRRGLLDRGAAAPRPPRARVLEPVTDSDLLDPWPSDAERASEGSLRPRKLEEFVGQARVREQLGIVLESARRRGLPPDHLLFSGPPGLGKTSLAAIVAAELGVGFRVTSGPALERAGDLAAILTGLEAGDVLFVDEIHRLPRAVEEVLYPAMEDFQIDVVLGKGPGARSLRLDLPRFTLVAATTRTGLITSPLRDRFGFSARLDYYGPADLQAIVTRSAAILGVAIDQAGAGVLARRSRGTPRIANRLLRRVRDYAEVRADGAVDEAVAEAALELFEVDRLGLDKLDLALLRVLCERFGGAPVGLATLAVSVGEEQDTVEDVAEPYLLQLGFLQRTPRGRVATAAAFAHLGLERAPGPRRGPAQAPCSSRRTRSRIAAASAPSEVLNPWKVAGRSSSSC